MPELCITIVNPIFSEQCDSKGEKRKMQSLLFFPLSTSNHQPVHHQLGQASELYLYPYPEST